MSVSTIKLNQQILCGSCHKPLSLTKHRVEPVSAIERVTETYECQNPMCTLFTQIIVVTERVSFWAWLLGRVKARHRHALAQAPERGRA